MNKFLELAMPKNLSSELIELPQVASQKSVTEFLGLPEFIWNGIFTIIATLICGMLVASFTSIFLKKKEERTRIAGIIVEKRINCEQEILRFLEKELFKEELNLDNSTKYDNEIMDEIRKFGASPTHTAPQYAVIFKNPEDFQKFFHAFEEHISSAKLWIDRHVRIHLMVMQGYFSLINTMPLIVRRIPLPDGQALTDEEFQRVCKKALFFLGLLLDDEINLLIMELEALIVDSVYKLDLSRPKKSFSRNRMVNKDMARVLSRLSQTILESQREEVFFLVFDLVYSEKGIDISDTDEIEKIIKSMGANFGEDIFSGDSCEYSHTGAHSGETK